MNGSDSTNLLEVQTDRLRILIIHWGKSGGGPLFTYELTKAFAARSDVAVHLSYNTNADISERLAEIRVPALPVTTYSNRAQVVLGLPKLLVMSLRLRRYVRKNEIAVVFSTMFSVWQCLAVRIYTPNPTKYFTSIHDVLAHPGDEHVVKRLLFITDLKRANGAVTYSSTVRDVLLSTANVIGKELIGTVHGIYGDLGQPRQLVVGSPVVLGFFGRLAAYKGIDLLLEAFALLRESDPSKRYELHIYGEGDRDLVARAVEEADVSIHPGWVPDANVATIIASFDILVLPYKEASQSGPLTYALGACVPVVVTPVGALPEQIEQGRFGTVARSVSSEDIARAITLTADPNQYAAISRQMFESGRSQYSWDRVASDVVSGMRKVCMRPAAEPRGIES